MRFPLKFIKPIKKYLEKEEIKLTKRKEDLDREDPFSDTSRLNDNAASDTEAAEEVGHETVSVLKKEIDRTLIVVRKTLTRIKLGRYGLCIKCGKMIDTDRLAINPTAEYCMECAKKQTKSN